MSQHIHTILLVGLFTLVAGYANPNRVRADDALAPSNDPRAATMLALPSAGKFAPGGLFRLRTGDRFDVEFLKADKIRGRCRLDIPASPYIWTIDPTIVGGDGALQIKLDGYNPAAVHGTGISEIQFTMRASGLWLFVTFGEKGSIGCVELVEEKYKVLFLATGRKDGKVNGALFHFSAKNLRALRQDPQGGKEFDKYVNPILELFGLGMS